METYELTQKRLKELLSYDQNTGLFYWKVSRRGVKQGTVAGTKTKRGYIQIRIDGKSYLAHRLTWLFFYGEWPKQHIDHINHNTSDNRIDNLREASQQENTKNRSKNKNNTSGISGVHWDKKSNKWQARIGVNGKRIHLGFFDNKEEAIAGR
jgi:hypothetical protein